MDKLVYDLLAFLSVAQDDQIKTPAVKLFLWRQPACLNLLVWQQQAMAAIITLGTGQRKKHYPPGNHHASHL